MDILCQAKSGMGKTAVFVLATLQQLEPTDNQCYVLVMCHTRELAFQISKEYERFSKYMSGVKVAVFFGGMPIQKDEETLKTTNPHIVVGTPGRVLALIRNKKLNLKNLKHFILGKSSILNLKVVFYLIVFVFFSFFCFLQMNVTRCSNNLVSLNS